MPTADDPIYRSCNEQKWRVKMASGEVNREDEEKGEGEREANRSCLPLATPMIW